MAVTKEQPFPQALAATVAGFQKGDSASQGILAIRPNPQESLCGRERVRKVGIARYRTLVSSENTGYDLEV